MRNAEFGTLTEATADAFWELWRSYERSLRAENRSEQTLRTYRAGAERFAAWCAEEGLTLDPVLITPDQIRRFIGYQLAENKPATAMARWKALRGFFNWLVQEEELAVSPMLRIKAPTLPETPVPVPTVEAVKAVLAATSGGEFGDRRDRAIIRLMVDSGLRRSEVAGILVKDLDLDEQTVTVRSKGGDTDVVPFGKKAAAELDRYLRLRGKHPKRHDEQLFIGQYGGLTSNAVYQMIQRRAREAGLPHLHPHQFRHAFADSLKKSGASDEDVQRLGRWRDPKMMRRYASANADARARAVHAAMSPGDRL